VREERVVELGEERTDAHMGREHRSPCCLGRMCGEDELERDPASDLVAGHVIEPGEGLLERLGEHALLVRVDAAAADAVLLLRDVRELEVGRERAQDARLALERELAHRCGEVVLRAAGPRRACEAAQPLDVVEQALVLLLDEHAAEQVAEQADVPPKRRVCRLVGPDRHGAKRRPECPQNRTIEAQNRDSALASEHG
jgi:hypothetical protein